MTRYSRLQLSDEALSQQLQASFAFERASTAELIADISEFDARKLYLPAGYPSMFSYCVGKFGLSEQAAFKRIRAARVARRYPSIFPAIEDGRLNLTLVVLIAPFLRFENSGAALLTSAEGKSRSEVEQLLAERFPRADVPARLREMRQVSVPAVSPQGTLTAMSPLQSGPPRPWTVEASVQHAETPNSTPDDPASTPSTPQLSPGTVGTAELPTPAVAASGPGTTQTVDGSPLVGASSNMATPHAPRPRVTPLSPKRYALQVTLGQTAHDKLRKAQALLGHVFPSGDIAQVFEKVLDLAIAQLERRKFAATTRHTKPRKTKSRSTHSRTIPAHVKRAVTARDGGQCTFVGSDGHRCAERALLEFDHVLPFAHGGTATVDGIRLRCRAHNQYTAEQVFGAEFMSRKRSASYNRSKEAT